MALMKTKSKRGNEAIPQKYKKEGTTTNVKERIGRRAILINRLWGEGIFGKELIMGKEIGILEKTFSQSIRKDNPN